MDTAEIIESLVELGRQRRYYMQQRMRAEQSLKAYLASCSGYSPTDGDGKKLWKEIDLVVQAVRKDESASLPAWVDVAAIAATDSMIAPMKTAEKALEKAIGKRALDLPVAEWWVGQRGLGILGLGLLVAEAGDLKRYATKMRLWKRLGLAVIEGERQRKMKGATALAHGYSPARRAVTWNIGESLFRAQWSAPKDENGKNANMTKKEIIIPAGPTGKWGEIYAYRRSVTEPRIAETESLETYLRTPGGQLFLNPAKWTPSRVHADAKRYMTKALVKATWQKWRGEAA